MMGERGLTQPPTKLEKKEEREREWEERRHKEKVYIQSKSSVTEFLADPLPSLY